MKFSTTVKTDVRVTTKLFTELCGQDAPEEFNPLGKTYDVSSIEELLQRIYHLVANCYFFNLNPIPHLRKYFTNTEIGNTSEDGLWWKHLRNDVTHIIYPPGLMGPIVWISVKRFVGSERIALLNGTEENLLENGEKYQVKQRDALQERGFKIVYARHLRM
jgi:hypothetical protein